VRPLRGVLLALVDLLALSLAWGVAYALWGWGKLHQDPRLYLEAAPLLFLFLLAYAQAGLYPGFGVGAVELLRRLTLRTSLVFLVVSGVTYWAKLPHQYSRVTVVLAWLGSLATVPLARFLFVHLVGRTRWWREPAVLVGTVPAVEGLWQRLREAVSLGYQPVAVLLTERASPSSAALEGCPLGSLEEAPELARRGVRVALLRLHGSPSGGSTLDFLRRHFRSVIFFPGAEEAPVDGAEVRDLGGILGIEFSSQLLKRRNRFLKRSVDVVLGGLGCLLAAPVVALAALAVRATSRGGAFFAQDRVGLGGRRIRVWKLRTMYADAEVRLERHLAVNPAARREWETRFKLQHDPRIVPVIGQLLRRLSLDELPQLLNVLRGDMSLVGPRPFPDYHLQRFSESFREFRAQVRPGLTGLWQVLVRSDGGLEEQEALDRYYIRNWSLWLDLYILARTTVAVASGKGAR
jgi:Undecaprenyl-phosphate galactose phosphotransferase WbaP